MRESFVLTAHCSLLIASLHCLVNVSNLYGGSRHQSFTLGQSSRRALLLHGFPGTPAELLPLAEFLQAGGLEARAPLLPGLGLNIAELGRTRWQSWVDAARDAWDELRAGADRAFLLGFSMGGAAALNLVAALPPEERPERLVLIAPFGRLADPRTKLLPVLRYVLPQLRPFEKADLGTEAVRSQFRRLEPTLDLDDPEVQTAIRTQVVLPTSSLVELQRIGAHAYRAAPRVTVPTLVIQGRDDQAVAPADTRRLALRLGGPITYHELGGTHDLILSGEPGHEEVLRLLERALLTRI